MKILAYQADIFDHLLNTNCDGAVVFGRQGGTAFSTTYADFAMAHPELYNEQGILLRPWQMAQSEPITINLENQVKHIYFISNPTNADGCDITHLAWELVRGLRELSNNGVTKICFNGARSSQHTMDTKINNERADVRVNWILGMLKKYRKNHPGKFEEIHLVSLNDVFIRNFREI